MASAAVLASERSSAALAARDAVSYTCQCCGQVVAPNAVDRARHVQRRKLVDDTVVNDLCSRCAADAEYLATERRLADKTHRDRLAALIAAATS